MGNTFYEWIDLLWIPLGLLCVRKGQYLMATAFILVCIGSLRVQVQLMESTQHPNGFMGWLPGTAYDRGLVFYGLLIALFLLLAHLSPRTKGAVFLAAILTLYILGLCGSMIVMLV